MWKAIITQRAFIAATATIEVTYDVYNDDGTQLVVQGLVANGAAFEEVSLRIKERVELMKAAKNEFNNIEIGTEITL